jgi:hypothetical protein
LIWRKILDSAVDEVSETLSMHQAPLAIQIIVVPVGLIVLLGLCNPPHRWTGMVGLSQPGFAIALSYPVFMPKLSTHRMPDPGSIVPHIRPKVFTDNQMSRIKYYYYISRVSKDYDDSAEWNSERLYNTIGTITGATRSLELLVEEF